MLHTERWGLNIYMNDKFLHDMRLYDGVRTLLFLWWTITVEPVLKGTCIEIPPVYKDHLEILWISSLYPQSACMYLWLVLSQKKDVISYSKNISDVKNVKQKVEKKAANQANSKLWCINYTSYVLKIVYLTCFVCWSSTQPYWYIFSSWPHSDFTSLSRSVTCTFMTSAFFYIRDVFGIGPSLLTWIKN